MKPLLNICQLFSVVVVANRALGLFVYSNLFSKNDLLSKGVALTRAGFRIAYAAFLVLLFTAHAAFAQSDNAANPIADAATLYTEALSLIDSREFSSALKTLRSIQARYPEYERISSVQTRIAVLHEADDAGNALNHYLSALDKQDSNDIESALSTLDFIIAQYPQSSLRDDAIYLKAYVQIMQRFDFQAARSTLAVLRAEFGESAYTDSADYLDAIALEQLGNTDAAREALITLRKRHTAVSLPFGFSLPEGNVLSRYWYDRADRRLEILERHLDNASTMNLQAVSDNGAMRVSVNVDGVDLELDLTPGLLTQEASWVDGVLQDAQPPAAGIFTGRVVGDPESWVRAVVVDDVITGTAFAYGKRYTLKSDSLTGTLDYYQPMKTVRRSAAARIDSTSTDIDLIEDAIVTPIPLDDSATITKRSAASSNDMRVVPISVVIDSAFDRYHGGNGLVTALNQINVADGVYRQFGIALAVDEVQVYGDEDADPIEAGPATLETYLKSFRTYRLKQKTFFSDSALAYLFTGKERTDRTLGLAWIDTLCRLDGFDVGIITPSAIGDVLVTHELGHSLGSQHDTDTVCNQDSTRLMWPNISAATTTQFSSCSEQMLSGARAKSCLVNAIDVALSVTGGSDYIVFTTRNSDAALVTDATLSIETSMQGLVEWPAGCRSITPTSAQCVIGSLQPGEQREMSLVVNAELSQNAVITAQLQPSGTQDFEPSNNTVVYDLDSQSANSSVLLSATQHDDSSPNVSQPAAASGGVGFAFFGYLFIALVWRKKRIEFNAQRMLALFKWPLYQRDTSILRLSVS